MVSAIIVAAGGSTRMGTGDSKQFIPLCGKPAISYTLAAFQACALIDEIVVVSRAQDIDRIAQLAKESPCPELERVEYGQMFERSMKYIYPYYWNKTNQPELLAMLKEYLKKYKSDFFSTSTHSWRYNSLARVAAISTRAYYYLMRIIRKLTDED